MCPDRANELRKIESVADAVAFCLINSNLLKSNSEFTNEKIKNYFKLSDKQFAIYFIKTMAETKLYSEIENFTKNRIVSSENRFDYKNLKLMFFSMLDVS
jgi:hypothetical protein